MTRKIIALCLVLVAVSAAFTGCKDKEPEKPKVPAIPEVPEIPTE